jgi:arsenate reductase
LKINIYHNPKCGKSRFALDFIEKNGLEFQVIRYLDKAISEMEWRNLLSKSRAKPIEFIRVKEAKQAEVNFDSELSADAVIAILTAHPKLLQRPVLETEKHAGVCRSEQEIKDFLMLNQ